MRRTNKSDLIEALVDEVNLPPAEATNIVNTILNSMSDALKSGEGIELRGFGTFRVKQYGSYIGKNPRTGEPIEIKPKKLPVFRTGRHLQRALNQNQASRK